MHGENGTNWNIIFNYSLHILAGVAPVLSPEFQTEISVFENKCYWNLQRKFPSVKISILDKAFTAWKKN